MPWGSWLSRGSCWVGGLICLLTWEMGHWKGLGRKTCKYFGSIGWDFLSKNIYGEWKHNPGSCVAGANPHTLSPSWIWRAIREKRPGWQCHPCMGESS